MSSRCGTGSETSTTAHTGDTVFADRVAWEGVPLFYKLRTFHDVGQWDYPYLAYQWTEHDLDIDEPGSAHRLDLWPQLGRFTRSYSDSLDGCEVRLRFDITTRLVE